MYPRPPGIRWWYESLDRLRRQRGFAMDRAGLGPAETPCRILLQQPGMRLRHYGGAPGKPFALIVPAPIKRPYIWDLAPQRSVVRHALGRGMQVCLIEWTDPTGASAAFGLEEYGYLLIDRSIDAIAASSATAQSPVCLLGHSLGGIFAATYAALRPDRIAGLVTLEAPLHLGAASGSFLPMLAFGPRAAHIVQWFDTIPGSLLNQVSVLASPTSFHAECCADFVDSLSSRKMLDSHLQVQRWTLDEAPMSPRLFEQVVECLYREDRFMRGCLHLGGKDIGPASVASPFLAVYDPRSLIIPPASVIAFHEAAASVEKRLLAYHGDKGVALAHVGALIGRNAHEKLWPEIFDWVNVVAAGH